MPYRLPQPDLPPGHRFDRCPICRRPLIHPRVGRPRRTCSPACRQKLHRRRYELYNPDDRAYRRAGRRADVELARLERRFGPFDDTPGQGVPSLRWRIRYRLDRGIPFLTCRECGRPFIHDTDAGLGVRYCSRRCKYHAHRRYHAIGKAVYVHHHLLIDEAIIRRVQRREPLSFCAHCGIFFIPNPAARRAPKYCSRKCRQAAYYRRSHPRILGRTRCPECGHRFAVHTPRHRYCSDRCADRASDRRRRPRRMHFWGHCIVCGVSIPNGVRSYPRQYCSPRCKDVAYRQRKKQRREQSLAQPRRCHWCGTALGWQANARRLYCSELCKHRMNNQHRRLRLRADRLSRPPVQRACAACGQVFTVRSRAVGWQRFCSVRCKMRAYRASRRAILAPSIFTPSIPALHEELPLSEFGEGAGG